MGDHIEIREAPTHSGRGGNPTRVESSVVGAVQDALASSLGVVNLGSSSTAGDSLKSSTLSSFEAFSSCISRSHLSETRLSVLL